MKRCAVITAAGCSSRMGTFKPVLPVAGHPAILHLLNTFFSAGISHAVIVTGFRHEIIEELLSDRTDVTLAHNPDYQTTQMFDSVRIGLQSVPDDCSEILLNPVDIPLVSKDTVCKVINTPGDLVFPSYQMRRGHPMKIHRRQIPVILKYDGKNGLRGALRTLTVEPRYIVVEDPFIIRDMDTPEDYAALVRDMKAHSETAAR